MSLTRLLTRSLALGADTVAAAQHGHRQALRVPIFGRHRMLHEHRRAAHCAHDFTDRLRAEKAEQGKGVLSPVMLDTVPVLDGLTGELRRAQTGDARGADLAREILLLQPADPAWHATLRRLLDNLR